MDSLYGGGGGSGELGRFEVAQRGIARAEMAQIRTALDQYAIENGARYPDSLEALVTPDERGYRYLSSTTVPHDPWQNPYQYVPPAPGQYDPVLFSLGADGVPGGTGAASDIYFGEDP